MILSAVLVVLFVLCVVNGCVVVYLVDSVRHSFRLHTRALAIFKAWEDQAQAQASVNKNVLSTIVALQARLSAHREALNQLGKNDQRLFELLVQLDLIDIDPPALTVN